MNHSNNNIKLNKDFIIRVVEDDYKYFFKTIKDVLVYPKNNNCFNMSFCKFYNNKYLFCVRNIIKFKQLIKDVNLKPGIRGYSTEEKSLFTNSNISDISVWDWQNYYETHIFFIGDLDSKLLKIKIDESIIPYTLISPKYSYKLPEYYKNLRSNSHSLTQEDFRLFFNNNKCYVYDSYINNIYIVNIYKSKINLLLRHTDICSNVKNKKSYHKIFEKNWSLYNINNDEFQFIHDFEVDGIYGVSYFSKKQICIKKKLISYNPNTMPIRSKFIRFSFGTPCIKINNSYYGIGHIKIKYNILKIEENEIKTDIERYFIDLGKKIHLKMRKYDNYKPHRWVIYSMFFFKYDEKTFYMSDLFMPIPKYNFVFSLSFPMSLQLIQDNIIISSGLGDHTNILLNIQKNSFFEKIKYNIENINLEKLKVFFQFLFSK